MLSEYHFEINNSQRRKSTSTPNQNPDYRSKTLPEPFPQHIVYTPNCEEDNENGTNRMTAQFQNALLPRKLGTKERTRLNDSKTGVRVGQMVNAFLELYIQNKTTNNTPFPQSHNTAIFNGVLKMINQLYIIKSNGGTDNRSGTKFTYQWDKEDENGANARTAANREALKSKKGKGRGEEDYRIEFENNDGFNLRNF